MEAVGLERSSAQRWPDQRLLARGPQIGGGRCQLRGWDVPGFGLEATSSKMAVISSAVISSEMVIVGSEVVAVGLEVVSLAVSTGWLLARRRLDLRLSDWRPSAWRLQLSGWRLSAQMWSCWLGACRLRGCRLSGCCLWLASFVGFVEGWQYSIKFVRSCSPSSWCSLVLSISFVYWLYQRWPLGAWRMDLGDFDYG